MICHDVMIHPSLQQPTQQRRLDRTPHPHQKHRTCAAPTKASATPTTDNRNILAWASAVLPVWYGGVGVGGGRVNQRVGTRECARLPSRSTDGVRRIMQSTEQVNRSGTAHLSHQIDQADRVDCERGLKFIRSNKQSFPGGRGCPAPNNGSRNSSASLHQSIRARSEHDWGKPRQNACLGTIDRSINGPH